MQKLQSQSPFMAVLTRITDLILLNLITLVCCLPVFTIGAALTGMHYVLRRMSRDEEGYVVPGFFASFKENFLQATGMWLIFLLLYGVFLIDLLLTLPGRAGEAPAVRLPFILRALLIVGGIFIYFMSLYAFPLLARFRNTVPGTLRSAAVLVVAAFPVTIGMALATFALPIIILIMPPLIPLFFLIGLTGPGWVCAKLYVPLFGRIEKRGKGSGASGAKDPAGPSRKDLCQSDEKSP